MKTIHKLLAAFAILLSATSCVGDYEMPDLPAPSYDGPEANITIAEYRNRFGSAPSGTLIEDDLILRAVVTGDDEGGNIYKQLIIEDGTGGISVQVDANNLFNTYHVGQEIYLDLNGLYTSIYGGELQIGYANGDRIPSDTFDEHAHRNGWPHPESVEPKAFTDLSELNNDVQGNVFTLVRLDSVYFLNGGEAQFAPVQGEYGQEYLSDRYGNQLLVRTSGYSNFRTETLPVGYGKVMGILGRYNGTWQLTIRTIDDVYGFDGKPVDGTGGDEEPDQNVLFSETFGTPERGSDGNWPSVSSYIGFDNPASMFEDPTGYLTVRAQGGRGNVWFSANHDNSLLINGIDCGSATQATLTIEVGANVYDAGEEMDLNALKVRCNGVELDVPSRVVSGDRSEGNLPFSLEIPHVAVSNNTTLEFAAEATTNTYGLRLFSVKLETE